MCGSAKEVRLSTQDLGASANHQPGVYSEELLQRRVQSHYNRLIKPASSRVLASLFLVALSPVFAVVASAVVIDSGLPIFYRADRGGFRGNSFSIYKFRTMVRDADIKGGGTTAMNDDRITRVGRFLRRSKLDEIPQLLNIVKGDMCFVGPRPELLQYTNQYSGVERFILEVRPGITDFSSLEFIDLAAIVGSDDADSVYETKILIRKNMLRLKYVSQISAATDMRLFFRTIGRTVQQATNIKGQKG